MAEITTLDLCVFLWLDWIQCFQCTWTPQLQARSSVGGTIDSKGWDCPFSLYWLPPLPTHAPPMLFCLRLPRRYLFLLKRETQNRTFWWSTFNKVAYYNHPLVSRCRCSGRPWLISDPICFRLHGWHENIFGEEEKHDPEDVKRFSVWECWMWRLWGSRPPGFFSYSMGLTCDQMCLKSSTGNPND